MGFRRYPARRAWQLTLLLMLACVPLAVPAQSANVADELVVQEASGAVKIRLRNAWQMPASGMVVTLPATVSTGADGAMSLRQGQTTISIAANTAVELIAGPGSGKVLQRVVQDQGSAFYDIAPRESNRFRVETPYLVAVIKGTQFDVTVAAESASVALFEGRLQVEAPEVGDVVNLREGQIARRHKDDGRITVINMSDGETASRGGDVSPDSGGGSSGPDDSERLATVADAGVGSSDDGSEPGLTGVIDGTVTIDDGTVDVGIGTDVGGNGTPGANLDVDLAAAGGKIETGIEAGAGLGDIGVEAGVDVGVDLGNGTIDAGVDTGIDLGVASVEAGVDAGLDLGNGTVDVGVDAGADLGGVTADIGADVGADLDSGAVDVGLDAGADLGGATADIGADVGADLDSGAVDVGLDAGADLGSATADIGADVGADLDGGTADVGLDAGADLGGATTDAGAVATADLGAGEVDVGLDVGAELGGAAVDTGVDVGTDLDDGAVGIGAGADLGGTPVDVDAGVDVGGGTVEVAASVGGIDLGLGLGDDGGLIELDLGGSADDDTGTEEADDDTDTGLRGLRDLFGR